MRLMYRMKYSLIIIVLRWLAVLPGAILASVLGSTIFRMLWRWSTSRFVDPDTFLFKVGIEWASSVFLGGIFIYAAAVIAPKHSKVVAFVMVGIGLVFNGMILGNLYWGIEGWSVFATIAVCIGMGAITYGIVMGRIDVYDRNSDVYDRNSMDSF